MNKKLFLATTLLFAIMGSVSKAAPTMLNAHCNYMAANDTIIDENVLNSVQTSYPGSLETLWDFIQKNTVYPPIALEQEIQGEAVVEFCVQEDGTIDEVFMLKELSPECDKALMDAVLKLKRLVPANAADKHATVWVVLSVSFIINDIRNAEPLNVIIPGEHARVVVQHIELSYSPIARIQ